MKSAKEKLNEREEERDFFCIVNDSFRIFARRSSIVLGSAWAFALATVIIAIWGLTGPTFHFSNTWQLIINTGTTIVTFLMVFLIQNTQNRDSKAINLKLDEVIRSPMKTSRTSRNSSSMSARKQSGTERGPVLSRASRADCELRANVFSRR
jgi:low affinity Fe/Cu permease